MHTHSAHTQSLAEYIYRHANGSLNVMECLNVTYVHRREEENIWGSSLVQRQRAIYAKLVLLSDLKRASSFVSIEHSWLHISFECKGLNKDKAVIIHITHSVCEQHLQFITESIILDTLVRHLTSCTAECGSAKLPLCTFFDINPKIMHSAVFHQNAHRLSSVLKIHVFNFIQIHLIQKFHP